MTEKDLKGLGNEQFTIGERLMNSEELKGAEICGLFYLAVKQTRYKRTKKRALRNAFQKMPATHGSRKTITSLAEAPGRLVKP